MNAKIVEKQNSPHIPFSVLMTVHDGAHPDFFEAAVDSVIGQQTLKPAELVLVKDGKLSQILEERISILIQRYPIMRLFSIGENLGQAKASLYGLKQCQYEWVARMDSDDLSLPDRFEKQFTYLREHPDLAALGGQIEEFHELPGDGWNLRRVPTKHIDIVKFSKFRNPMNNMTTVYRKSAVEKLYFDTGQRFGEDYALFISLILNGAQLGNLPDILVNARVGAGGIATKRRGFSLIAGDVIVFKKMYDAKFINSFQYLRNLFGLVFIAYMPVSITKLMYQYLLREKKKNGME